MAVLAGLAVRPAGAIELVRDGKPVAVIVAETGGDAAAPASARKKKAAEPAGEAAAVEVLLEWIRKISGAELPVVREAPASGPAIFVGRAARAAGLAVDGIASPTHEGVRIVADDRRVLLAGQSDAATLKAACRFLEALGCRCFMDGPLGEVYPRAPTLRVGNLDITEKPGLRYRNPKGPSWRTTLWKEWNGAGGEAIQHQHAWGAYVDPKLFAEHPDFFAMGADGQRKAGGWLCTSNPRLREYFSARVIEAIRSGRRHPSLSPTDGRGYCQCPACRAQDVPGLIEPSSGAVSVSTRYADFFDDVARRVGAACPDSVLSFYVYADYTQPPAAGRSLALNLCAVIAPIRYCRLHGIGHAGCPDRVQQAAMVDGWAAAADRLGYYNYMYNLADATLPMFKFTACREDFAFLRERGLEMMTLEVLSNWHIYGPQIYLGLRLAYDPAADAAAIMDDYWTNFYGQAAAPHMRDYWMGIDEAAARRPAHAGSFFGLAQIYTDEFLAVCRERLARAAEAARGNPDYAQRVELHTEGFRSAEEYRAIMSAMERGDCAGAKAVYERMLARLHGLAAKGWANPEYATAYLERFLGPAVNAGAAAAAAPRVVRAVLPDRWRYAVDEKDQGAKDGWAAASFDDSAWTKVCMRGPTLGDQGLDRHTNQWFRTRFEAPKTAGRLILFFAEVDGVAEVFVNGTLVATAPAAGAKPAADGRIRPRVPFEADITAATAAGENVLALRVDHTRMTDLSLGGVLRPVVLLEEPR